MRFLVSQPQLAAADGSKVGDVPVGIVRWRGPEEIFALVVKITFSYADGAPDADGIEVAKLVEDQAQLSLAVASDLDGAAEGELAYGSDFQFFKHRCDVLLHGHAYSATPAHGIDAEIKIGDMHRRFQVVSREAATRLPLVQAAITNEPVGPREVPREEPDITFEDVRFTRYQYAALEQQLEDELDPDALIELTGLSERGPRKIKLPDLYPQLYLDAGLFGDGNVPLRGDTLWIDTDQQLIHCVYRGTAPVKTSQMSSIVEMIVSIEQGEPRHPDELVKTMCRGTFHYAVEEDDLPEGPPEVEEGLLTRAKLRARTETPEPQITMERYAQVSAELAESKQERAAILDRHGFDADSWSLEERGWMGRISDATMAGDFGPSEQYSALFVAAQATLTDPNESAMSIDDYAELKIAMETGGTGKVLRDHEMTVASWIRIDNRWAADARGDAAVKRKLDAAIERARAKRNGSHA